jgi:hypothetical protein
MIRLSTILWLAVAGGVVAGLFQLKGEVSGLEKSLIALKRDANSEREAVQILRAEWSYLNRSERLDALAAKHLADLVPIKGRQIARIDRLDDLLNTFLPRQRAQAPPEPGGRRPR